MKFAGQLLILIAIVFAFWLCVLGSNPPGVASQPGTANHWLRYGLGIGGGLAVCLAVILIGGVFWMIHNARRAEMMEKRKYVSEERPSLFAYIGMIISGANGNFRSSRWKNGKPK